MNRPAEISASSDISENVLSTKSELRAEGLRKQYKKRVVVSDVSLQVSSGQVVGLLGPNGAGKTTCFYMIVGLVPVDGGAIYLDRTDLSRLPIFRRSRLGVAYLPQEASSPSRKIFRRYWSCVIYPATKLNLAAMR